MSTEPSSTSNDSTDSTAQPPTRTTEPTMSIARLLGESSSSGKTPTFSTEPLLKPKSEAPDYPTWERFLADLGRSFDKSSSFHPPTDHLVRIEPVTERSTPTDSVFIPSSQTPSTSTTEPAGLKEEPISSPSSPAPVQPSTSEDQLSPTVPSDSSTESSSSVEKVKEEPASPEEEDSNSPIPDIKDPNLFQWNPFVMTGVAEEVTIETTYPKIESPTPIELDDTPNCQALFNREQCNQTTAEISRRFMEFICGTSKSMKFFAEAIVGVAETTLYSYLKNPSPWEQLKGKKKAYWRMANWLDLPEVDQAGIMEMSVEEAASITRVKRQRKRREPATPRIVLSKFQKERLVRAVQDKPNSSWTEMEKLALEVGLEAKQVKNFFKNNKNRC